MQTPDSANSHLLEMSAYRTAYLFIALMVLNTDNKNPSSAKGDDKRSSPPKQSNHLAMKAGLDS